ncbi:MAG: PVC-type heme-binding CxxCH protein [Planctomycetota bacterium]|nr:PVC-type heme-binding CxxCH protein [Planctomycetota bacterium]
MLFSPIANENLHDRNLPDGSANNARLKLYTAAMAEVAAEQNIPFIDLFKFKPDGGMRTSLDPHLTINGVHLTELGYEKLAAYIDYKLRHATGRSNDVQRLDDKQLESVREAVKQKNFYWFHRYRVTDGFSTYGGRADLKFTNGQTNREVLQRELEVLDAMTAQRDRAIWAAAAGDTTHQTAKDKEVPPFIPVITNKPGKLPGGKHLILKPDDEAISRMTVAKNMKVNLFASEVEFPELVNPVQMSFDSRGRLWVAAWRTYPHWKPGEKMDDKLLILEDTNGDGKADKCTTFADDLHCPTGFEFWNGGVIVGMQPDVVFLKDTNGDDKADSRETILNGIDSADTHHAANSFVLDPGGALYFQEGTFHHTQFETPYGPTVRNANAGVYRYDPRTMKPEVYVTYPFANPHGHVFDRWGQDVVIDGTGAVPYHGALFSGYLPFPLKHSRAPQVYKQRTRPCPAAEILSSTHFPEANQGNLLVANVIGFQGILQYKMKDDGASFSADEMEPIVSSTDPNFRPADIEMGADGAIYFTDWHNPIIGHMQHNLRDPSRAREYGRVYRVTYEGRELSKPAKIAGQPIPELLDLLKHPEDRVRYRARIELSGRPTSEVISATNKWLVSLDPKHSDYENQVLQALWMHQHHNEINLPLLERVLSSSDFRSRAAAARVLCYWRDSVPNSLDIFKRLAMDSHPRVRLEAIRAASYYQIPEAIEVSLIAAELPSDKYLDYVRGETFTALDPLVKQRLAEGRDIEFTTDAGRRFLLQQVSTEDLLKRPRSKVIYNELLNRPGIRDTDRREAIMGLAHLEKKSEVEVIMQAIRSLDSRPDNPDESVVYDLIRQLTSRSATELATARAELQKLALSAKKPVFRQIGLATLVAVDGNADQVWKLAQTSQASLLDMLSAVSIISDAGAKAQLYSEIEPLLQGLPRTISNQTQSGTIPGRLVQISLGRGQTLTLAEVEVYSRGKNVARSGKAKQKSTAFGGDASRGIDGNKSGAYAAGGQTHSELESNSPFWEVDLLSVQPIESVVVYNRTDGNLGKRLNGFTLRIFDANRKLLHVEDNIPAPAISKTFDFGTGDPVGTVRRAAMLALAQIRGQEARTFELLTPLIISDTDRATAIRALQGIPRNLWPNTTVQSLLDAVLSSLRSLPAAQRTTTEAIEAIEFCRSLASFLPAEQGRKVRGELDELGVRTIRIGTLFERMSYDRDMLVVQAGKPVEFLFENTDLMPHNFVIVRPGSMEEIGLAAEATAQQPDAATRHFVPSSDKVLLGSRLLQPRESQKLAWNVPKTPGVYPYVCTYPGHWRKMYGALYVVADMEAYLLDPEVYLAANPLSIKDELLNDRRPRTEWKYEDLAGAVEQLQPGRSFGSAKQIFTIATCISCHRMDEKGANIGPDLRQLDPKFKPADILKELLDPSARINENFQTYTILLDSGKTLTGLIVEENADELKLVENAAAKPITISIKEIDERQKSETSMMPKGLLDKLSREEILDLIAYIVARGNPKHPLFGQGGHEHHHHH